MACFFIVHIFHGNANHLSGQVRCFLMHRFPSRCLQQGFDQCPHVVTDFVDDQAENMHRSRSV